MRAVVLGGGAWGSALALVLAERFDQVSVWEHQAGSADATQAKRENARYLPGVRLADNIRVLSGDPGLAGADIVVLAVPSSYLRATWAQHAPALSAGQLLVVATKGIEPESLLTMSQLCAAVSAELKAPAPRLVTLSGPSHAEEVGRRLPTTVVAAGHDLASTQKAQLAFNRDWFRVYSSEDHLGVELGGALKNVIALAAGVSDGLGLGDNSKAALITRGLAEMTRLGVAMGAKAETFAGLAGVGDLVVTCMSQHSRNRHVGERLGRGERWSQIQQSFRKAVEGAVTARSVVALAQRHGVELPIASEVHAILYQDKDARAALRDLMRREPRAEGEADHG